MHPPIRTCLGGVDRNHLDARWVGVNRTAVDRQCEDAEHHYGLKLPVFAGGLMQLAFPGLCFTYLTDILLSHLYCQQLSVGVDLAVHLRCFIAVEFGQQKLEGVERSSSGMMYLCANRNSTVVLCAHRYGMHLSSNR